MRSGRNECGFVCWDGGRREKDEKGLDVCILEKEPGYLLGSGEFHTIVLRHDVTPGSPNFKQALENIIRQAQWFLEE